MEEKAIKGSPERADYIHDMGHILAKSKGRKKEAIEMFKKALSLEPNQLVHLKCLSTLLRAEGMEEQANLLEEENENIQSEEKRKNVLICDFTGLK